MGVPYKTIGAVVISLPLMVGVGNGEKSRPIQKQQVRIEDDLESRLKTIINNISSTL